MSKRHVGHVVRCGRVNHGRRHDAWKTWAHGRTTIFPFRASSAFFSASGTVSCESDGVDDDDDRGLPSISTSIFSPAESAGSGLSRLSKQIAQTTCSPSTIPTRSIRLTSPSGTCSSPRSNRFARPGSSGSSVLNPLNGTHGILPMRSRSDWKKALKSSLPFGPPCVCGASPGAPSGVGLKGVNGNLSSKKTGGTALPGPGCCGLGPGGGGAAEFVPIVGRISTVNDMRLKGIGGR